MELKWKKLTGGILQQIKLMREGNVIFNSSLTHYIFKKDLENLLEYEN